MTVTASKYPLKDNEKYETEPWAVLALVQSLKELGLWRNGTIWEPAAGNHAMLDPLINSGANNVVTSDICTYDQNHSFLFDFFDNALPSNTPADFDLITNPPYGPGNHKARKFVELALDRCSGYVAILLTAKFDFGKTRTHLFRDSPRFCAKIALLDRISWEGNGKGGTEDHAWYVWGPRGSKYSAPKILYRGKD